MPSKHWPKKRVRRLADEITAYMKHVAKPENGDHGIYIYTPEKAACGVCLLMRKAHDLKEYLYEETERLK